MTHVLGDRRDYFQARKDIWEVLTMIVDGRKKREIDPTVQMLRECVAEGKRDHETPEEVKERIATMLEFLEEVSGWYDQIRAMPRPTLLKLMRMGSRWPKSSAEGPSSARRCAPSCQRVGRVVEGIEEQLLRRQAALDELVAHGFHHRRRAARVHIEILQPSDDPRAPLRARGRGDRSNRLTVAARTEPACSADSDARR